MVAIRPHGARFAGWVQDTAGNRDRLVQRYAMLVLDISLSNDGFSGVLDLYYEQPSAVLLKDIFTLFMLSKQAQKINLKASKVEKRENLLISKYHNANR